MRRPLRASSLVLAAVLLGVLVPGCGSDGLGRPVLVASAPAQGSLAASGVGSVRLDFDQPVTLLLDYQAQVVRDGVVLPSVAFQRDDEPGSVRVRLRAPEAFSPGSYEVRVLEGLVVNADEQYALEPQSFTFEVAGAPAWYVGSPATGHVVEFDDATLSAISATPTPGGRAPVAILAQQQGAGTRVFVQLADGGGSGRSLAHYLAGDSAMSEVLLATSGGDLLASAPTLLLEPQGAVAYAAFRDPAAGTVRLSRVGTLDGVETGSLLLAVPPAPDCAPTALLWREGEPDTLLVVARSGGVGWLSTVEATAWSEQDSDPALPGVQAQPLGIAAGAAALAGTQLLVAPPSASTADVEAFQLEDGTLASFPVLQPGTPRTLRTTYDQALVVQGLAAGPGSELLATRSVLDLTLFSPVDISDDVGGLSQGATEVLGVAPVPGQRRLYVLLDASCLAFVAWDAGVLVQDDLDAGLPGVQVLPLTGLAAGATCVGTREGGLP